jgi:NTP pyrophosphatase (non-canonical NTP hydrolase)
MSDLTLEYIVAVNAKRCEAWHQGDKPWTIERWITATVGELGELTEVVLLSLVTSAMGRMANDAKKIFRAEDGSIGILKGETLDNLRKEVSKEWADVMLYMLLLAYYSRINPSEAIREVFNAKSEQLGFEERL